MKSVKYLLLLLCLFATVACDDGPATEQVSFTSSFPKPNKKLSAILGDTILLKYGTDTLVLAIKSGKDFNLITNVATHDTLFNGKVSKFRGLYYFSQAFSDSSYLIHTVKIADNLIYGLTSGYRQANIIDEEVRKGAHSNLVKYRSPDSTVIRLYADKKELRKLFSSIIRTEQPATILNYKSQPLHVLNTVTGAALPDPEVATLDVKIHPNPIMDFVNIQTPHQYLNYRLIDINGKEVASGELRKPTVQVNTSTLRKGIYILTLSDRTGNGIESFKLMKN